MSSFSSVVQKPGRKIVPKAAPRRNLQRRAAQNVAVSQENIQGEGPISETEILQNSEPAQPVDGVGQIENAPRELEIASEPTVGSIPRPSTVDEAYLSNATLRANATAVSLNSTQSSFLEPVPHYDSLSTPQPEARSSLPRISTTEPTEKQLPSNRSEQEQPEFISEGHVRLPLEAATPSNASSPSVRRSTRAKRNFEAPEPSLRMSKRRKMTPQPAPEIALSQMRSVTPSTTSSQPPVLTPAPPAENRGSPDQSLDSLLKSATQRAASVSEMAINIESQTRLLRPRTTRTSGGGNSADSQLDISQRSKPAASPLKRHRQKKTAEAQAAEVVANAIGTAVRSGRQRRMTPENAEEYELEPSKVTMGDLCDDNKLGKKSALEAEMQENWAEILQRRREDRERALINAEKRRRKGHVQAFTLSTSQEPVAALAPAMAVVNGVIVVDQASREIDRSAQLQQAADQDLVNVREDRDYYKNVHQGTVGVKPGHGQHSKWDEESTELFFRGLRMFGTDFLMIANMFPGLTRKQIKAKFIREENANKGRILECLHKREAVDLEAYAQMANKETEDFQTLESIQKELDEQEKKLREEDNQRRKREGFATNNDTDGQDQSAQQDIQNSEGRQTQSVEPGRFDAVARDIMAPKKRQRKTTVSNNKRGQKGGKQLEGGVEEILGSIDEVAV